MAAQLDDSRPTYLQVADALRVEIKRGAIQPGDRLPSVRDLATRFDIAAVTVQNALRVLRDEGYVVSRSTRGYFVRNELPAAEGPTEDASPEFLALRDQLAAIQFTVQTLTDRVTQLESTVRQAGADPAGSGPSAPQADG